MVLIFSKYQLLFQDWRGYILAGFALVWIANIYMSLFALIRADIKKDNTEIREMDERSAEKLEEHNHKKD
ncbi:MAG: hypothetical protein ABIX36_27245 [Mucilaginibacter sp.]